MSWFDKEEMHLNGWKMDMTHWLTIHTTTITKPPPHHHHHFNTTQTLWKLLAPEQKMQGLRHIMTKPASSPPKTTSHAKQKAPTPFFISQQPCWNENEDEED